MTTDTTIALDGVDAALAKAAGNLASDEQRLAVAVYRLLGDGQPVAIDRAAANAGIPVA